MGGDGGVEGVDCGGNVATIQGESLENDCVQIFRILGSEANSLDGAVRVTDSDNFLESDTSNSAASKGLDQLMGNLYL